MSTGAIFTVLSNIPWGQVVDNAPKVASGAAKLWTAVTGGGRQDAPESEAPASPLAPEPPALDALKTQVRELERTVHDLQGQMQASSELIRALADQNTQLVQRVELNRARLLRLSLAAGACAALVVPALVYLGLAVRAAA